METKNKKSWKSIFINDENSSEPQKQTTTKFPESNPSFDSFGATKTPNPTFQSGQVSQETLAKLMDVYEKKFFDLNQPNYDFFEFFQSVVHGDINNPQTFTMAFGMGMAMDKTITKDKLLAQSEHYVNELNLVYTQYVSRGNAKKDELTNQKNSEAQTLSSDLTNLKEQLEAIKIQIQDREQKLSKIDAKYQPELSEVDEKLQANDMAKTKILSTIEAVKNGIKNNLK